VSDKKSEQDKYSRSNGLYSPAGFDGHYYLQLAAHQAKVVANKPPETWASRTADRIQSWTKQA
jgi:hypothetical protein